MLFKLSLMPTVESWCPLWSPWGLVFDLWLSMSRGDLLTLSKPKLEALGGLWTLEEALFAYYTPNVDDEVFEGWKSLYDNKHMMETKKKEYEIYNSDMLDVPKMKSQSSPLFLLNRDFKLILKWPNGKHISSRSAP